MVFNMTAIETLDQIKKLVEDRVEESKFIEFKQDISDPHSVTKEVTAFSNADGGELIVGVIDKDGVATGLSPIKKERVAERIAQIIEHKTEPKLEDFRILVIDDDRDESTGYVVVKAGRSSKAPHMDTNEFRYYVRREKRSVPMLDSEVKALLVRRGHTWSLMSEIKTNLDIAEKAIKHVSNLMQFTLGSRRPSLFFLLRTEAWRAFQYSGYASIVATDVMNKLVSVYNLVDEINNIIEFTNVRLTNETIAAPVEGVLPDHGIYVPILIDLKMRELKRCLEDLATSLRGI
jgi:hypothetical protein